MILVFLDRSRRADRYPWLRWKVRLFALGAGLAAGGIAMGSDGLVLAAIVVLAAGFFLRFLPGGTGEHVESESAEESEEEWTR